jgi:hypothetical protein
MIIQSGENLLVIINDLLDLSNLQAGRLPVHVKEFYMSAFLRRVNLMFATRIEQKGLTFVKEFAPDLPERSYGDEGRLRQILMNLLGNAVKFTEQGSVTFRVLKIEEDDAHEVANPPTKRLRFEVEDTGVGIPPEHLEKIFDAFHQIGEKRLAQTKGIGLGLTVSQRLAQMLGSDLHVQSTLNTGSRFWFDVDIAEDIVTQKKSPKTAPKAEEHVDSGYQLEKQTPEPIIPPSNPQMHELLNLTKMGDVLAIREYAQLLKEDNPAFNAFVDRVITLVDVYQTAELQRFLEDLLKTT